MTYEYIALNTAMASMFLMPFPEHTVTVLHEADDPKPPLIAPTLRVTPASDSPGAVTTPDYAEVSLPPPEYREKSVSPEAYASTTLVTPLGECPPSGQLMVSPSVDRTIVVVHL